MFLLALCLYGQESEDWVRLMFAPPTGNARQPVPEFGDAYGVALRDLTNDGRPDLYVVRFRNLNRLLINRGPGKTFQDRTIPSGLGGNLAPRGLQNLELGVAVADYDNDGVPDVLVTGWGETTRLFHQGRDGRFNDVTTTAGIVLPVSGNAGVWSDIDRDGDLDLFLTTEHGPNRLYRQERPGRFREVAALYGVADTAVSQGAAGGDLDGDGYPDLYVCNWLGPDRLYRNVAGRRFEPVALPLQHLTTDLNSNGVSFGDLDNDGDLDVLVTDRQGDSRLYRNDTEPGDTTWKFTDVTAAVGLNNPYPAYSGVIADFNNDGWQDIFFTNIGPNLLFLNRAGSFDLVYREAVAFPAGGRNYSTGAAAADIDRDGDLDLFVANKDTNCVLAVNPLQHATAIRIRLEGVRSNRDGIGSKVRLTDAADRLIGYRELSSGMGYLSAGEAVVHFGTPGNGPYTVRVEFPSGKVVVRRDLVPGTTMAIRELEGLPATLVRMQQFLGQLLRQPSFWLNLLLLLLLATLIGGFVSFALYRYRWSKRQIAGFLAAILILLYLLLWLLTDRPTWTVLLIQLTFMLGVIAAVTGFMERIRQLQQRRFAYRGVLQEFSDRLILIRDNRELAEQLVRVTFRNIPVQFCSFMEVQSGRARPVASAGATDEQPEPFNLTEEQQASLVGRQSLPAQEIAGGFPELARSGVRWLIPIARPQRLLALLLLGPPREGSDLLPEDVSLLSILANQAALAIENNRYIEETKRLTRKVTAAEIREQYVRELEEKNTTLEKLYRELQETQAQLVHSEKLSSLGQLVAGIAHELNNPIAYIYANMQELQRYLALLTAPREPGRTPSQDTRELEFVQEDLQSLLAESLEGSRRVKRIVEALRNFSRLDEAEFKRADLHEGIESTLMLLRKEFADRIRVERDFGAIPPIDCLPGHLNQVFMNLLLNAAQAITGPGTIRITTRRENGRVRIEICDDGPGIPPEALDKIFDPFYTTKEVGEGTGLGLSISYGIIRRHGGTITVESEVGRTCFTIRLPIRQTEKREEENG
jgi:signal transduction histidine kinase